MKKKILALILTCAITTTLFAGCGKSSSDGGKITLTILGTRTDLVNTKFKEYTKEYSKLHPNVKLKFEAYTDYDKSTTTRMKSSDYGDVLLVPSLIKQKDYPKYFAELGTEKELSKKYYGLVGAGDAYGGKIYQIPSDMVLTGMVYNKKVFKDAGITNIPTNEEDFLKDMKMIKDKEPNVIPLYTNYKDQWPLSQWEGDAVSVSGVDTYDNIDKVNSDKVFLQGDPYYTVFKLMYDAAKNKLIEPDPTTTDWEKSKTMLAQGKIGVMELGSWAIVQIQSQAKNKDDIGFMPFPHQVNGKSYTNMSTDSQYAVNKNSKHVAEAKELLTWLVEKCDLSDYSGSISTLKSKKIPSQLQAFKDLGVTFITSKAAKKDQAGLGDQINKAGEVGLGQPEFKQKIIEAAIGNSNATFDQIMKDENAKWKAGRKAAAQQ